MNSVEAKSLREGERIKQRLYEAGLFVSEDPNIPDIAVALPPARVS